MDFIKNEWTKKDGLEFQKYLKSLEDINKKEWSKNIVNTNMEVLAIKAPILKSIAKEILKGNYISFLNLNLYDTYENTVINAIIICNIKEHSILKEYLFKYVEKIDNWASCDIIHFNTKNNEEKFYNLSLELINNNKPFVKRCGIRILFYLLNNKDYINKIFSILNSFYDENNYYVNMINAWLFCECFIKYKKETIIFLKTHKLNKFTINKGIQKCRDSYRIDIKDKEFLLKYKI